MDEEDIRIRLNRWIHHNPSCNLMSGLDKTDCTCGLDQALALLRSKPDAGEFVENIKDTLAAMDMEKAIALIVAKDAELKAQATELKAKDEKIMGLKEALGKLQQWAKAYPLEVFPEPDFKRVRKALKEYGILLAAVSASNMRHVITQVNKIIEQALGDKSL